ncbi:DUF2567 domain-containing protein [Gordonia sp. NPDC003429]
MNRGRPASPIVAVAASVLLLGVVAGAVWAVTTPAMAGSVTAEGPAVPAGQLGEEFAGVGAFCLLMFGYGVVSAIVAWVAARRWRGVAGFGVLFVAVLAGSAIAGWVGTRIAHLHFTDPHSAAVGETFRVVPDLWSDGVTSAGYTAPWIVLICAPLAATLVYLLCTLATRSADLGVGDGAEETIPAESVTSGA